MTTNRRVRKKIRRAMRSVRRDYIRAVESAAVKASEPSVRGINGRAQFSIRVRMLDDRERKIAERRLDRVLDRAGAA